jgi:hypothetical protein
MDLVTDETSLAIASQKKMTSTEGRLILRGRFTNLVCRIHDVRERRASTGSTIEGSSFFGLLTGVDIGHIRIGVAGNVRIKSRGSGSSLSQRTKSPGARISGMRSWISATISLASVVITAKCESIARCRFFPVFPEPANGDSPPERICV